MPNIPHVVLTVPHRCISGLYDPGCDKNALAFARQIQSGLRRKRIPCTLITSQQPGFTPRSKCDLNRVPCRNCRMRREVDDTLTRAKRGTVALFDIHTFPRGATVFKPGAEIVVMSGPTQRYAHQLYNVVRRTVPDNTNVHYMQSALNDIVEQSIRRHHVPAALIEIADHTPSMKHITKAISAYLAETF